MRHIIDAEREQRLLAETLLNTAMLLNQSLDMETILDQLLAHIGEVIPHDAADIRLIEGEHAYVVRARGYSPHNITPDSENYRLCVQDFANLRAMWETGQPMIIRDTRADPNWVSFDNFDANLHSLVGAPILWENEVIGFIQLLGKQPDYFREQSAAQLEAFAAEAALAIQNARLYAQIQQHAAELEQRVLERTSELRESEARYRAIVEAQLDMVIRFTPDHQITFVNDAAHRLIGRHTQKVLGTDLQELLPESVRKGFDQMLDQLSPTTTTHINEHPYVDTQGQSAWIQWRTSIILDEHGKISEIQSVGRDITQLKLMEEQLRQALERELEINELRSRFISMAAHDMRNPLAVIQSAMDLLNRYRDRLTEQQRVKRFQDIQTSIHTMVNLLDDLLTIGQVEAGKLNFSPAKLDLVPFCKGIVEEISLTTGRFNEVRLETTACDRTFVLDQKLMWHILSNLISNAIKYSAEGSPVDLKVICLDNTLTIQVQDTGIGIPEDEQSEVFKAFHRFSNVGGIPGTGLGLAIVKRAVELHGGAIAFESEEGKGTTFTIDIPLD